MLEFCLCQLFRGFFYGFSMIPNRPLAHFCLFHVLCLGKACLWHLWLLCLVDF